GLPKGRFHRRCNTWHPALTDPAAQDVLADRAVVGEEVPVVAGDIQPTDPGRAAARPGRTQTQVIRRNSSCLLGALETVGARGPGPRRHLGRSQASPLPPEDGEQVPAGYEQNLASIAKAYPPPPAPQ